MCVSRKAVSRLNGRTHRAEKMQRTRRMMKAAENGFKKSWKRRKGEEKTKLNETKSRQIGLSEGSEQKNKNECPKGCERKLLGCRLVDDYWRVFVVRVTEFH